jgi:hypothetical protein
MYILVLALHNWVRWAVLLLVGWALARAFVGLVAHKPWGKTDRLSGMLYTVAFDVQLLLGLVLFFALSPLTTSALSDLATAMRSDPVRFFVAEHSPMMAFAWALAHVGSAVARRGADDAHKHRRAAIWFGLSALAIILAIPWSRPLLRF